MADTSGSAGEVRVRLTLDADDLKTQLNSAKQTIGSGDDGVPLVGMLDEATTVKKIQGQTGAISKGLVGEESRILLVGGLDKSKTIRAVNKAIDEIGEQSKGGLKSIVIPVQLDFSEEDSEKLDAIVQAGTAARKKPSPRKKTQKRAMGGHVQPGVEYVVGEEGPERVRFGQSGTVIPNHNVKPIPRYHEGGYAIRGHRHSEDGKMYKDPRNGNWYPTIVRTPEERRLHQAMGSSRRNGTGQSWEVASIKRLPLAVRQGREQQQHYDPRIDPRPPYAHRGDPYAGAAQVNEERRRRELADEDLVEPVYGPHGLPPATQDEFAAELSKFDDDITKTKSKRKLLRLQKARSQFLSQSAEALNSNQVRVRKVIPPAPRRRLEVKDDTGQAAQPAPSALRGKRGLVETSISTGSRAAGGDPRAVRSQEAMQEAILSDLDPGPTATPEQLAAASQAEYEHQARRVGRQHSIDQWITQHSGRPKNQRWKYRRDFGRSRLPEGVVRGQLALDDLTKPGLMGTVRRVDLGTMAMPGQDPRNHPWLSHLRAPAWGPLVASGEDPRGMPAATKGRRTVTPGQGEAPQQLFLSANPERQVKDPRIGMHSTYAPNRDADMAAMLMARSIAQQGATGKVRMTPGAGPDFKPTAAPLPEDEPLKTQAQIRLYANPRGPMREPIEYEDGEWTPAFPKVAGTDPKGHWADPQTRERWVQGPPRTPYTPEWSRGRVSRVPLSMEDDDELQFKLKQDRKGLHKGFRIGRFVYNAERQVLTAQEEEELNELRRYGTEESERRWRELQTIKNIVRDASVIGATTDDDEAKQEKIRTQDFLDAFSPALNSTAIAPVSSEVVGPHGSRSRLTAESFYRDPTRPPPPPDHVSRDRKITPRARRRMLNRLVPGLGTLIGAQSRADRRISNLPSEMGATVISGFTGEEVYATEEAMMELSKVSGLSRQMAAKWQKTYGKPGEPLPRWEQASPGLKRDLATIYPEVLELDAEAQDEALQGIYEMEVLRPDRGQVSKASKEIKALKKQGRPRDALGDLTLNYAVSGMADQQTERYGDMLKPEARAKVAKTLREHDRRVEEAKNSGNQAKVEVFTAARQEFLDNFLAENPRVAQRIEQGLDPSERIRSSGIGIGDDGELLDAEIDPETGLPRYSMPDARAMLLRTTMQSLGMTRQVTATEIRIADLNRRIEGAEEAVQVATHGEHESAAKRDVAIEAAKTERSQLKAARTEAKKAIGDILAPKGYSMGGKLRRQLALLGRAPEAPSVIGSHVRPDKPKGALWSSTYLPKSNTSDWERYAEQELDWHHSLTDEKSKGYLLDPDPKARIFHINDMRDYKELMSSFPGRAAGWDDYDSRHVDWPRAATELDAVHLSKRGQWKTRYGDTNTSDWSKTNDGMYGWDVESTAWLNKGFSVAGERPPKLRGGDEYDVQAELANAIEAGDKDYEAFLRQKWGLRSRAMGGPLTQRLMQSKIQKAYDDGKYEEGQRLQKQLEQAKGGWEEQEDDQQTQSPMVQRAVKGLLPGKTFAGGGIRTAIRGLFSARQSAKGHAYGSMPELAAHPGAALMGERGPEDVFGADGTVEKVGQNGPEVVVPSQDVVIAPNHWDGDPGSIPGVSKPPKERDFVAELKSYQSEVAPKEGITGIPEWLKKGYAKGGGLLGRGVGMPAHQLLAEKLAEKSAKRKQQERQTPEWLRRSLEMNQGKDLTGYARGGWQPKSPIMYDMDLPGEWVEYRKQAPPGTSWQKPYPTQLEGARDRLSKSGGDAIRPWLPEMRRFGRGGKWSPQHGDIMLNRAGWVIDATTKQRISMSQEDYNRLPVFDPDSEQGSARGRTQLNRALRTSPNLGQQTLGFTSPSQYPGHGHYTNVYEDRFPEQSQRVIGPADSAAPQQLSMGSVPTNVPYGPYGIGSHIALRGRTLHRAGQGVGPQVINLPGPGQTGPQGFQAQVNNWMAGNAGSPQQVNQAAQQHQQNAAQQQQAAQQAATRAGRNAAGQMGAQAWMAYFQGFGINNNLAQQAATQAGQQQGQQQQQQGQQGQQGQGQGQGQQAPVAQPGGQPSMSQGPMPLGTAGRRSVGYTAVHGGQMTQQQQQVLGRMGLGGGGSFGTDDYMEQIAGIRSGVSEQLSLTPVRALSVSVGQIFQQLGGRAGVQKRAVLANQASAEAQKAAGQLDRYRQDRAGIEGELTLRQNDPDFINDTGAQGQAALQKRRAQLLQAESNIEPVVQQKVADAKLAEKQVSTGAQRLGLQGLGLAGIVTGTVIFSKAMEVVSGGMAALADVVDKATDELTGFVRTSNMAADQLSAVAVGGTGGQAEIAAAQARFGMATSTEELDRRARLQAGATNYQTIRDQLRAERNFGERDRDEGVITGFNNGPLAGTPIIGDWLGWIGQQQSITQLLSSTGAREGSYSGNVGLGGVRTSDFAAALGLEDISALRPANKTTENDEGERIYRAGVTVEEMIQKINRNRRPEDRYDVPSADVVSQRLLDQGMGRTEATTTESQEAQLDQVKALYAELNDNQKKVNKTLGKFTVNEDEAFSDESKATAAFFRDKELFGLADQIEQFGVVFETNAKDLNDALETAMENAATGSNYQDIGGLLEGMRPQLDARVRGIERQAAYQRDTLIPANFARSFIQSPTTPTTPLQGIAATGPFGASTPTAGLEEYGDTIKTLSTQVNDFVEQGLERMREEMDIPDDIINSVRDLGNEIRSLNEMSESMSLGMDQERYNEQLFLSRRALGDAVGLVGQQSASYSKLTDVSRRKVDGETEVTYEYEQQVIQATKLGQLQAAQVSDQREMARLNRLQALDQRELARISLARSQRELNLQIALSRLQSPGETPQERAVRRREAELIAREKQRELDINKRTTERGFGVEDIGYRSQQRGFQIEDIGYRRALRDALKAAKLSESERTIQLELRGVQKAIQLTQVVQQTKTGYLDLGMTVASQVQEAVMGVQETLEAQSGQFADDFKGEVEKIFAPIKKEVIETLGLISGDGGSSYPAPDDITNGTGGGHTQKKGTDAAGGIFDAKGATSFIAGEAGSEHVVVLRNPRLGMTSGGPAGGGGGVMNKTVNVTINASVRGDGDIDRLVDKVKRAIHDEAAVVGVA